MARVRLVWTFIRMGLLNELQYRANFFAAILEAALSIAVSLGGLALVYSHTDTLGGWTGPELLALLGVFYIMSGYIQAFVQPSMEVFLRDVRQGTLDFTLTKPQDSPLLVSIRAFSVWNLVYVVLGLVLIGIALARLGESIGLAGAIGFAITLLTGAVIVYSFWLMLATVAFWFVKIENILVIFRSMYQAGRWPVGIYPPFLRIVLTFLVPVAFAVTVPAETLTGRATAVTVAASIVLAAVIFGLARGFWRVGVRHYSGASA